MNTFSRESTEMSKQHREFALSWSGKISTLVKSDEAYIRNTSRRLTREMLAERARRGKVKITSFGKNNGIL